MTSSAQKKAVQLLEESGCFSLPANLEKVAKHLKAHISYEDFEDEMSGVLVVKNGKRAIGVNAHHHPNRQRFTIAHEIGHLVLHYSRSDNDVHLDKKWAYFRSEAHVDQKEVEANQFAAELLMPEALLKKLIREQSINFTDDIEVAKLAQFLRVSEQALTIRLVNLKFVKNWSAKG